MEKVADSWSKTSKAVKTWNISILWIVKMFHLTLFDRHLNPNCFHNGDAVYKAVISISSCHFTRCFGSLSSSWKIIAQIKTNIHFMVPDVEFLEDFSWFWYIFGKVLEIRILHVFSTYQTPIGPVPNPYRVLGPYLGVKGPWISVPNYVIWWIFGGSTCNFCILRVATCDPKQSYPWAGSFAHQHPQNPSERCGSQVAWLSSD